LDSGEAHLQCAIIYFTKIYIYSGKLKMDS
jgi:hypothetical protein